MVLLNNRTTPQVSSNHFAQQGSPLFALCQPRGAHAAGEHNNVTGDDDQQPDTDMADAEQADFEMEDAPLHDPQQQQDSVQLGSPVQQPSPQPAWVPPRAAQICEDIGYLGFFADVQQQVQPLKEELEKLLPGRDGSVLVMASSPLTGAEALTGISSYMCQLVPASSTLLDSADCALRARTIVYTSWQCQALVQQALMYRVECQFKKRSCRRATAYSLSTQSSAGPPNV